jgi:hypothetical protein
MNKLLILPLLYFIVTFIGLKQTSAKRVIQLLIISRLIFIMAFTWQINIIFDIININLYHCLFILVGYILLFVVTEWTFTNKQRNCLKVLNVIVVLIILLVLLGTIII